MCHSLVFGGKIQSEKVNIMTLTIQYNEITERMVWGSTWVIAKGNGITESNKGSRVPCQEWLCKGG